MLTSAWGASWWASWGNAWGGWTAEIDEALIYYGGGQRRPPSRQYSQRREPSYDEVSRQWDLLEARLRNQAEVADDRPHAEPERAPIRETGTETPVAMSPDVVLGMPKALLMADAADAPDVEPKEQARRRRNQAALLLILSQA